VADLATKAKITDKKKYIFLLFFTGNEEGRIP